MRYLPFIALAALAATPAAQGPDQDALRERRDKKLASEFLKRAPWMTDYDKAKAAARKSNELIFAYFTRSYSP